MKETENLPSGWAETKLEECVFFQEGPGLRKWQFGESGVPFLNIRTLQNGWIDKSKCQFVKPEEFENKYEHFLLDAGDLVVSSSGTLGKLALIREEDLPLMLNTSTIRFRTRNAKVLSQDFLRCYLQSHHFFKQIETFKTGSAIFNYGPSHLKQMNIVIPPLNEQRRIVEKLDRVLERVESCRARLDGVPKTLKRFRHSVLAAACSGRLTADWRLQNPDVESAPIYWEPVAIPNEFSELPKLWHLVRFGNLIADGPQNGLYKPASAYGSGITIVRIDNFHDGIIEPWNSLKLLEVPEQEARLFALQNGDILINRVNSMKFLGKAARVQNLERPCVFESNMMRIRVDTTYVETEYTSLYLQSFAGKKELQKNAKHAVNQSSINQQDVKAVLTPLPPLEEQREIVRRVQELFAWADSLEARYRKARTHFDKLAQATLAKAFRGELVPQDPNDEPASKLLARIRAAQSDGAAKSSTRKTREQKKSAAPVLEFD